MGIIPPLPLHVYRPDAPRSFDEKGKGRLPDGTYPQRVAKYEAPQGAAMRLDCPPTCRSSLRDPSVPLWITEGQKKADALASHGFCALALLGVWNWRGRNGLGGLTALADWEAVARNGRQVRIVFDSDVMRKPEVGQALARLRAFLGNRGATPTAVYLPPAPPLSRVGFRVEGLGWPGKESAGIGHGAAEPGLRVKATFRQGLSGDGCGQDAEETPAEAAQQAWLRASGGAAPGDVGCGQCAQGTDG
jgi:hypothetical protein